ncbi:MAG: DMT family transporter [Pseudomonadota bacterium]|nr:DMT family transporter [Pseudomonadota bacterium]
MSERVTNAAGAGSPRPAEGPPRLAYVIASLPPLFWSGNFLIARLMRDAIPPFQMSFWRWTLAFAILLPFAWTTGRERWPQLRQEAPYLAFLGLIGVTAFNCFIYVALHHTTVVNAALINSLMPAVTFLFALALLREPLPARRVLGLIVSLTGAAVIISRGRPSELLGLAFNRGDLLVLLGLTFWAGYTVMIRWRPTGLPPNLFLAATAGFGALFHLPLVAWELIAVGAFALDAASAAALLYFAVFPSVLAYIFWNRAVAALGPGRTGMFMHLMPIFSAVLAVVFLRETFLAYHAVGILLIMCGITLVTRPAARKGPD